MSLCELPSEILLKIFSFVEGKNVFVLPRICRRWRVICSTLTVQEIKWKHYPMKIEEFLVMLSKFRGFGSLDFDLGFKDLQEYNINYIFVIFWAQAFFKDLWFAVDSGFASVRNRPPRFSVI